MGRASRWLRAMLGMKKEKEKGSVFNSTSRDVKEKKGWIFAKSGNDSGKIPAVDSSSWMRTYMTESEKEQSKHAIAVAAATAAAADAAVAAAHAAVAVVRLTSHGRGTLFCGGRQRWAALTIQTFFRGFLARKALRALKGVVKLQALFRGYLIRKRATATLYSMQALIRVQVAVRSDRARRSLTRENKRKSNNDRSELDSKRYFPVSSAESCINGFDESPKIVEMDTFKPRTRSEASNDTFSSSPIRAPKFLKKSNCRKFDQPSDCVFASNECRFSTAQSSPRTPAKSVCGDSFFRPYTNFPNYMSDTKSFRAKLRSLSAPKQRPERKVVSLEEILASRNSISCVRMQRFSHDVKEELDL